MRIKNVLLMIEHAVLLLKKFNEQQTQGCIYRITEINQLANDKSTLTIQVIGKSTVIKCTPDEIVANDQMIEGFSKKDIRMITYLACIHANKPKYKIDTQEFCDTIKKIKFRLKKFGSNEIVSKTADQISLDKNLINKLSQEDVCSISYTAGYENSFINQIHSDTDNNII
jgi:hypothetical protein